MFNILETSITHLPNARRVGSFEEWPLKRALSAIKKGLHRSVVDEARAAFLVGEELRYKALKLKLPCFAFNGVFKSDGKVVNADFTGSSSLFHYDIDGLTPKRLIEVRNLLINMPSTAFLFVSTSGAGLKGASCINPKLVIDDASFKAVYARFETFFSSKGIKIDPSCKDVRRLCFTSYDPDLYYIRKPVVFQLDLALPALEAVDVYEDGYSPITEADSDYQPLPDINLDNAVSYLPPAGEQNRAEWLNVGMALHAQFTGSDEALEMFDIWSQKVREYKGFDDVAKTWKSFGKRTNGPLLDFRYLIKQHNKTKAEDNPTTTIKEPFSLAQFSLKGHSSEMREKMLDDKFVLGRIAILGQATVIYAKPNTGKTLLTLWMLVKAIEEENIIGDDVFYVNADDDFKGLVTKLELAEQHNFHMLSPGHKGFESRDLVKHMSTLVDNGTASGKIIILDTLKKFTELMDKRIASDFMREAREFVSNGGTLILLAHTNKNRDGNGKVIFGGTSDIVDDADCAYTLDEVGGDNSTKHVIFENMKCRGDVAKDAGYSYSIVKGVTYIERLESIASLDDEQVDQAKQTKLNTERMKKDGAAIKSIVELLERGDLLKTDLLHNVHQDTGLSKARIIRVMSDYEGTDFNKGNRWFVLRGDKNAKIYSLNRQFELHDNGLDDLSFSDDSNDVF